jgi:hypothetical protein
VEHDIAENIVVNHVPNLRGKAEKRRLDSFEPSADIDY